MASIRNVSGHWQAQVRRRGVNTSRTFASREEAELWARGLEQRLGGRSGGTPQRREPPLLGGAGVARLAKGPPVIPPAPLPLLEPPPGTFGAVLERYERQVLPQHRSGATELYLLRHLHDHWLMGVPAAELRSEHLAAYRDERLEQVKPGSVRRVFNLLRPMLDLARNEWGAVITGNPARQVSIRVGDDSRTGRLSAGQWQQFLAALRRRRNPDVVRAVELALETSMRRSELLALTWEDIDLEAGTAHLPVTKNGHPRTVALSPLAIALLEAGQDRTGPVLHCSASSIKCAFARAKAEVGLDELCFHQSRHEAISRMWELGLNETEIANQSGHRDWTMLRRYSHVHAETLAEKLQSLQDKP